MGGGRCFFVDFVGLLCLALGGGTFLFLCFIFRAGKRWGRGYLCFMLAISQVSASGGTYVAEDHDGGAEAVALVVAAKLANCLWCFEFSQRGGAGGWRVAAAMWMPVQLLLR